MCCKYLSQARCLPGIIELDFQRGSTMSNAYSPPPYSPAPGAPAPIAETSSAVIFAPLPLRARGVLENLDLAFKLFKQYWKPLLAWGALSNAMMLLALATSLSFLVGPPLLIGPICCVLAAAVRGQAVGFKQCWAFSQPRLGNVLAMHLLSSLIAGAIVGVLGLGLFMLSAALSSALPNVPALAGFFYILLVVLGVSTVLSLGLAWQGMVTMVCCMEDEHRSTSALKRAWTLLHGRWKAALGMLTILNLALLALWGVVYGVGALLLGFGALGQAFTGQGDDWAVIGLIAAVVVSGWMVFTLFLPIYYLAQALFYLDARVRNEALDLEWNAHRTVETSFGARQAQSYTEAPQTFFPTVEAPAAMTSTWAPTADAPFNTHTPPVSIPENQAASTWAPAPSASPSAPSPFAAPPQPAPPGAPAATPAAPSQPEPSASDSDAEDSASTWSSPFAPR